MNAVGSGFGGSQFVAQVSNLWVRGRLVAQVFNLPVERAQGTGDGKASDLGKDARDSWFGFGQTVGGSAANASAAGVG